MNILFIHQNFPGQFKHLAPALVRAGHQVTAMTMKKEAAGYRHGIRLVPYLAARGSTPGIHPWLTDFETKTIRGEACYRAALELKRAGHVPDAIIAHPGWGESLFIKEVWPAPPLGIYCEFHYRVEGADVGFDPEFSQPADDAACRLRLKNLNNLLHFEIATAGIAPTEWQAGTFPEPFRDKIAVVHDGIDTRRLAPNPQASITLGGKLELKAGDEVVTFVNRNLEPYRGYHVFMRALPELLRRRPRAHVLIVGGNQVSYGGKPDPQKYGERNWREIFIDEARPLIAPSDWERVHFVGKLPYDVFVALLQVSSVHVYLTYPFVLSWSLLEAMSVGCAIVASDTQPLREAITHGETGLLFDFFDPAALAGRVVELLEQPAERQRLGANARRFARDRYDLQTVCLPRQLDWVAGLARNGKS